MIEEPVIQEIRSIGLRMRETMEGFSFATNHQTVADEMNRLADRATQVSGYHDHIFQKCNVIRSHVSHFHRPRKHRAAVRDVMEPIDRLENWDPDEAGHPAQ
ncbi:MAG: hypothetical protein EOP88_21170 [Verrucomicrobiaceae bacterium]|nr:MAG: hypothetical protein EOP88_21170 [Verrucomicrobiaceae bacterium]